MPRGHGSVAPRASATAAPCGAGQRKLADEGNRRHTRAARSLVCAMSRQSPLAKETARCGCRAARRRRARARTCLSSSDALCCDATTTLGSGHRRIWFTRPSTLRKVGGPGEGVETDGGTEG